MASRLNPYLNFGGTARDAMEFYKSVFGGELTLMTFAEGGMPHDPGEKDLIMHGQLETPSGYTLMGADVPVSHGTPPQVNSSISLSGDAEAELRGYWDKLVVGGRVEQPLEKAPWGDSFGMLTDRFGTPWLVNISGAGGGAA
jgi:PhnB protein